ncbi:MAG: carbonic anhydrase [Terriglobales bacterium]
MKHALFCTVVLFGLLGVSLAQQIATAPAQSSHAQASHTHAAARPAASPDAVWADLMAGNQRFVAGKPRQRAVLPLRKKLASGQNPNVIILSCSDSRVPPELVFDQGLGDLFVVRTAGNVADPVALGSIEYAVEHINSPVLVVMGHQKCGAVSAACSGEKMPSDNLEAIMNKIGPAVNQAKTYAKGDDLLDAAVKENVGQSAKDLQTNSEIIRNAVQSGKLKIFEAEYSLDTGEVTRLNAPAGTQN